MTFRKVNSLLISLWLAFHDKVHFLNVLKILRFPKIVLRWSLGNWKMFERLINFLCFLVEYLWIEISVTLIKEFELIFHTFFFFNIRLFNFLSITGKAKMNSCSPMDAWRHQCGLTSINLHLLGLYEEWLLQVDLLSRIADRDSKRERVIGICYLQMMIIKRVSQNFCI